MMVTVVIKHTDTNPAVLFIFTIYLSKLFGLRTQCKSCWMHKSAYMVDTYLKLQSICTIYIRVGVEHFLKMELELVFRIAIK